MVVIGGMMIMKKKLLLIVLPALMVLAGCSNNSIKPVEEKEDLSGMMLEDTAAHEDLFGSIDLSVKKLGEPGETPSAGSGFINDPKIGVQFSGVYEGDIRNNLGVITGRGDCYAVRFVAAVNVSQEDLDNETVVATWKRGVSTKNGDDSAKPLSSSGSYRSTVAYATLNNGSTPTNASSEGNDYTHYLVYTMYDIPAANVDSYIMAYLTLSKDGEDDVFSKAVAARIGGGNAFSFVHNYDGFFMAGTLDGQANTIANDDNDTRDSGNNAASFTSYLAEGDTFVLAQKTSTIFKVWCGSTLNDEDANISNVSEMFTVGSSRRYVFYLNKSNKVTHTAYGTSKTDVYLRGPAASGSWDDLSLESPTRFVNDPDNDGGFIRFTFAAAGEFKITNQTGWGWSIGWGDTLHGDAKDNVHLEQGDGTNIRCKTPGTYDFYVNSGNAYVYFVRGLAA